MIENVNNIIRKLTHDDLDTYIDIWAKAYPGFELTKDAKQRWVERAVKVEDPLLNRYGYYQEGKLIGAVTLIDFSMNLFSTRTEIGGVANVCMDLTHKKEHGAKKLMLFSHDHFYERNMCLTALYPFRPDFYIKMGYGMGKKMNQYNFKPCFVPKTMKEGIFYPQTSDFEQILDCFNRYASQTHGMIFRNEKSIQRLLNSYNVVCYRKDGKIQGYIAYKFRKLNQENFILNKLIIDEFIYESKEARAALLTFLHTQDDQINRIILNTQDDCFHYLLSDPRNGSNAFFLTSQETNIQGVGIMYRVINTKQLFKVLENHNFGNQSVILKLSIKDNFLAKNNGDLIVSFEKGKPTVITEKKEFDVEISLNVANFSSMIMGVIPFRKLYNFGLAEISKEEFLKTVNQLFLVESHPITIEQF
ncbi:MAG: GNAT family N-acetyltransferase [Candidatus Hodarchaeales archaeon]|jgi:predicted acetyltransferase